MATISASPGMVRGSLPWARTRGRAVGLGEPVHPPEPATGDVPVPVTDAFPWRLVAAMVTAFVATLFLSGPISQGATSVVARVPAAASAVAPESVAHPARTVAAGDTLWAIAEDWTPQADPRATVEAIRSLNGLSPEHQLQAGEVLLLPVGS
ncbi:MAG: LysM peptidoglycan-binding domain-containing protein [Micrococcales bacterium]|nr:LysM peptidoglycan-binding domain-containing protein [Micrococcales bacterium]